jgi:hypothetical protein
MTIFSTRFTRLCACRALLALALKRSMKARWSAISFLTLPISSSMRSRSAAFDSSNSV